MVRYEKHWIEAVIDSLMITDEEHSRVSEAVEQALQAGKGTMIVIAARKSKGKRKELERFEGEMTYGTFGACPNHPEVVFENLEPRMFSFNSPVRGMSHLPRPRGDRGHLGGSSDPRSGQVDNGRRAGRLR